MVLPLKSYAHGPCENIQNYVFQPPVGDVRTCSMHSTVIDSTDFLITSDRDETVTGFYAAYNKNLEFLPKNVGEKFPNLLALEAYACSVKIISKETFKGLTKLQLLIISKNQIETIDDDTFDFIPAVERIWLGEWYC